MKGLIYIVDDDLSLRQSLAGLLSDEGFKIMQCPSAESFLALPVEHTPCCILLDVKMDGISGFELQTQLAKREFVPPIVFLTGSSTLQEAVIAMRAGAYHFLTKPVSDELLIDAVSQAIEESSTEAQFYNDMQQLTKTEQDIARLVKQGLITKQIAKKLDTSPRTVEWHRRNISKKINIAINGMPSEEEDSAEGSASG